MRKGTAIQQKEIINDANRLPECPTYERTVLCQDAAKDRAVNNYLPISCLLFIWKHLVGMIAEVMYGFLEREKILYYQMNRRVDKRGVVEQRTNC